MENKTQDQDQKVCMACSCSCDKRVEHNHLKQDEAATYRCTECGLRYRDQETASRCEAWCREHQSCNLDIIKHAVKEQAHVNGAKS